MNEKTGKTDAKESFECHDADIAVGCLALDLPETAGDQQKSERLIRVLPAPDSSGVLQTTDGRSFALPAGGMGELAAKLNRQDVNVRLDFDHETEPFCVGDRGPTGARGWVSGFHVDGRGGMSATVDLGKDAAKAIEEKRYRYLSPSLYHQRFGSEILGISSIALTNRPALGGRAHLSTQSGNQSMNASTDPAVAAAEKETALLKRETDIAAREKNLDAVLLTAVTGEIDAAVLAGSAIAPEKDHLVELLKNHKDGLQAGADSVRALLKSRETAPAADQALLKKAVPAGAPPTPTSAAAFNAPVGSKVDQGKLDLHHQIQTLAMEKNISYDQAMLIVH